MNANIIDHIGSKVTVWTKDGNAAENRVLFTVDEFGIVIENFNHQKQVFIPWLQVKYIDYTVETTRLTSQKEKNPIGFNGEYEYRGEEINEKTN